MSTLRLLRRTLLTASRRKRVPMTEFPRRVWQRAKGNTRSIAWGQMWSTIRAIVTAALAVWLGAAKGSSIGQALLLAVGALVAILLMLLLLEFVFVAPWQIGREQGDEINSLREAEQRQLELRQSPPDLKPSGKLEWGNGTGFRAELERLGVP